LIIPQTIKLKVPISLKWPAAAEMSCHQKQRFSRVVWLSCYCDE